MVCDLSHTTVQENKNAAKAVYDCPILQYTVRDSDTKEDSVANSKFISSSFSDFYCVLSSACVYLSLSLSNR